MTDDTEQVSTANLRLRLLATSDLHMQLTGFNYNTNQPAPGLGLVHLAPVIADARREAEALGVRTLLFDNGDALQGTPLGHFAVDDTATHHPLMRAFAHLEYDAIGLGNHDFDFGLDRLRRVLKQAPCPVICSNLHLTDPNQLSVLPHLVLPLGEDGPRLALFSCLPPQTTVWNAEFLRGRAKVSDILTSARAKVRDLKAQGCDIIVALAHTGLGDDLPSPLMENAACVLDGMADLDVVIAGHGHDVYPPRRQSGSMTAPGSMGSHLGIVDLDLCKTPESGWTVIRTTSEARKAGSRIDRDLARLLEPDHQRTRARLNASIGRTSQSLHSYFSLFGKDKALSTIAKAQAAAVMPFLHQTELARFPVLSAVAPTRFGGRGGPNNFTDIPAGPIHERHIFDLCSFDNRLSAGVLTGQEIIDWLEMAARSFNTICPGKGGSLIDPGVPGHNFDVIFGLTYEIDISVPPRFAHDGADLNPHSNRIRNICWNNEPLDKDKRFIVAMTSYRAAGGGNVSALRNLTSVGLHEITLRDVMRLYFSGQSEPGPLVNAPYPWRFATIDGGFATVQTSPLARAHLSELPNAVIEKDEDPQGFMTLRLALG